MNYKTTFKCAAVLLACLSLSVHAQQTPEQKQAKDWENFQKMIEERFHKDWAWKDRYRDENSKLPAPKKKEKRIVFMGNSITEGWINTDRDFFKNKPYVNRGIGGQTTPQMLVRFRQDVIDLKPFAVVILAGINDIAQNTGPSTMEAVAGNIFSMAELAKTHGITPILCSVLPAAGFPWNRNIDPKDSVLKLNTLLKDYAIKNKIQYVDYYSKMVNSERGMKSELASDGVHPNLTGYKLMEPLIEEKIIAVTRK